MNCPNCNKELDWSAVADFSGGFLGAICEDCAIEYRRPLTVVILDQNKNANNNGKTNKTNT